MEHYRANHFDHDHWLTPAPDGPRWELTTEDHLDVFTGRTAAEMIRTYDDDRPFYLQVCFPGPHPPFDAPGEWRALYDPFDPALSAGVGIEPPSPTSELFLGARAYWGRIETAAQARALRALYYAKLTMIDAVIGEILGALEARGLTEDTWVVYGSDHGEMLGDHGNVQKIVFHEGAIHVPAIIRPPGGAAPKVLDGLADQLDVTASIVEMGGLDAGDMVGRSLVPAVDSPGSWTGKSHVISQNAGDGRARFTMVRSADAKLVLRGRDPVELYDLRDDPGEFDNRVDDAALDAVRRELIDAAREELGA